MSHTLWVKWPSCTTHSPRPLTISIHMPTTVLLTLFETFPDKNILQHIIRHKPPALLNPIPPLCNELYHVILCLTSISSMKNTSLSSPITLPSDKTPNSSRLVHIKVNKANIPPLLGLSLLAIQAFLKSGPEGPLPCRALIKPWLACSDVYD